MSKGLSKLKKMLVKLGQVVVEIHNELEKNRELLKVSVLLQIAGSDKGPKVVVKDGRWFVDGREVLGYSVSKGRFHIDRDNAIWFQIKENPEYTIVEDWICSNLLTKDYELLIREYVHDIVLNLLIRRRIESTKVLNSLLLDRTNLLLEDLVVEMPHQGVVTPLYSLELDKTPLKIRNYAVIRRARYSELMEYSLGFDNKTGNQEFEYVLDLMPDVIPSLPFPDMAKANHRRVATLILALRLTFGGGVGSKFVHCWIQPNPAQSKIGQSHQLGYSEVQPSRALRPGGDITIIDSSEIKNLLRIIMLLEPVIVADESNIVRALLKHGQAVEAYIPIDKITDSIISLECLFGGYSKMVIAMSSLVVSTKGKPNADVAALVQNCYDARNKILHGASYEAAEKAAGGMLDEKSMQLVELVRSCLIRCLNLSSDEMETIKQKAKEVVNTPQSES